MCSWDNASELVQRGSVGGTGGEADFTGVVDSGVSNAPSESELLQKKQGDRRRSEYIELRVDLIISLKYKTSSLFCFHTVKLHIKFSTNTANKQHQFMRQHVISSYLHYRIK